MVSLASVLASASWTFIVFSCLVLFTRCWFVLNSTIRPSIRPFICPSNPSRGGTRSDGPFFTFFFVFFDWYIFSILRESLSIIWPCSSFLLFAWFNGTGTTFQVWSSPLQPLPSKLGNAGSRYNFAIEWIWNWLNNWMVNCMLYALSWAILWHVVVGIYAYETVSQTPKQNKRTWKRQSEWCQRGADSLRSNFSGTRRHRSQMRMITIIL